MTATLANVHPELAARCEWMIRENPGMWVTSGYRPRAEQEELYTRFLVYQNAVKKYGAASREAQSVWAPTAARPGLSRHERSPAEAVDIAWHLGVPNHPGPRIAAHYGLVTPISNEPWHFQLAPGHRPAIVVRHLAEATNGESMEFRIIPCPTGGYWHFRTTTGDVRANDGAPHFRSLIEIGVQPHGRRFGLTPFVQDDIVRGYWIYGDDGSVFAMGDAPYLGNYAEYPEWHGGNRKIIGLVQTAGCARPNRVKYALFGREEDELEWSVDRYDFPRD